MNPAVTHPDISRANFRFYFGLLRRELPEPPDGTTPDEQAEFEQKAMDAVLALHPDNDIECRLAVRVVSADAQAGHALGCARRVAADADKLRQCRAQAASMGRQSDSALRSLLRLQAIREKQEAEMHPAAMERAGYWFKEAQSNINRLAGRNRSFIQKNVQIKRRSGAPG